jgi:hypothetical protein
MSDEDGDALTVLYKIDDDVTWSILPTSSSPNVLPADFVSRVLSTTDGHTVAVTAFDGLEVSEMPVTFAVPSIFRKTSHKVNVTWDWPDMFTVHPFKRYNATISCTLDCGTTWLIQREPLETGQPIYGEIRQALYNGLSSGKHKLCFVADIDRTEYRSEVAFEVSPATNETIRKSKKCPIKGAFTGPREFFLDLENLSLDTISWEIDNNFWESFGKGKKGLEGMWDTLPVQGPGLKFIAIPRDAYLRLDWGDHTVRLTGKRRRRACFSEGLDFKVDDKSTKQVEAEKS